MNNSVTKDTCQTVYSVSIVLTLVLDLHYTNWSTRTSRSRGMRLTMVADCPNQRPKSIAVGIDAQFQRHPDQP